MLIGKRGHCLLFFCNFARRFFINRNMSYNRKEAVSYAEKYALTRNPQYYDFSSLGGDCTNFVSQCLFAGTGKMDFNKNGWFYENLNNRSPSWTGVKELGKYLITNNSNIIKAKIVNFDEIEIGDVIQLRQAEEFNHSLIVSRVYKPILSLNDIYICAHTNDRRNVRLSVYTFKELKFLKVLPL